jgi:hypothetical protein
MQRAPAFEIRPQAPIAQRRDGRFRPKLRVTKKLRLINDLPRRDAAMVY